jgi:lipopolysaccharide export system protein LptC
MITRGSLWLPLAILLLLAALSFWIEQSVQTAPNGSQAAQSDPEGIMENFDALRTDASGNPHYRLTAKRSSITPAASSPSWNRRASSSSTPRPAK